jgi:hypothetical protein
MSGQHRRRSTGLRRRLVASLVALAASAGTVATVQMPGANGAYSAKINSGNTAASTAYFTCAGATSDPQTRALFAYPFGESSGSTATDVSGNATANPGLYSNNIYGSGISYGGTDNPTCARDRRPYVTLSGQGVFSTGGYISGPASAAPSLDVFSEEIWFRTTTAAGMLVGYGSSRTGSSFTHDRNLYLDVTGRLVFGVHPSAAIRTISSPAPVTDGVWHHAVATLSGAGMALYLDGVQVDKDASVTTAEPQSGGYWRFGYDNLFAWPAAPVSYYFKGSLAFGAVYDRALTPAQVSAHYRAGS